MPYTFYKTLHFLGILMLFMAMGAFVFHSIGSKIKDHPARKIAIISHGLGSLIILIAGFGLLARLGIHWPWPGWVFAKVILWILISGSIGALYKKPEVSKVMWWVVIALGVLAAYFATWKPF